ncbi:MAG: hypothetical protein ABL894_04305 [Hyphomicrobium sp.]
MPSKRYSVRASRSKARQLSAEGLGIAIGTRPLTEADAIDIWIARWLRIRQCDLTKRYNCDPRRLYEIWEETRFAGTRAKALVVFRERHPALLDRVDPGAHRRIPTRSMHPGQLSFF